MATNSNPNPTKVRCAVYTRKSIAAGLDQDFNTLESQREHAEAYIASQKAEGWVLVPGDYNDGGYTGANIERPALKRLLADVKAGKIDCIVVYRLDRLTRSMRDLQSLIGLLDQNGAKFASVREQINTSGATGKLSLHLIAAIAEFERDIIAERTRDKARGARRRGKWIGGNLVLGYDVSPNGGALIVSRDEAQIVRHLFSLYLELGTLGLVLKAAHERGWRMKKWVTREGKQRGGKPFNKSTLYNLLKNPLYAGYINFENTMVKAESDVIVEPDLWERVQSQLAANGRGGTAIEHHSHAALLKGIISCDVCGARMIPTYTKKKTRLYRYYVCLTAHRSGWSSCKTRNVAAEGLESAVLSNIRTFVRQPVVLSEVLKHLTASKKDGKFVSDPGDVEGALVQFERLWEKLSVSERHKLVRAIIGHVKFNGETGDVTVGFRSAGIQNLCQAGGSL